MGAEWLVKLCNDWSFRFPRFASTVVDLPADDPSSPLGVEELITCLRQRWRATYDLQLVVRRQRLYLQVMWAYLEQQSFPMDEAAYRVHVAEVLDVVNRLGLAAEVRCWLASTRDKPRLGKALSLHLEAAGPESESLLREFLV